MTERDIFLALLDLPDLAARAAYLDRVCAGDAVLRARVDSLLQSHDTAGTFLGSPAVAPSDTSGDVTHELGRRADEDEGAKTDDEALAYLAPSGRPDSLGRIGHYEVLEVLGRGGFGVVFRAFDDILERVVAVKMLAPRMAATSPARKRFLREARSYAQVRHQNVVQVYAVEEQPIPYLVMEFIPGETLQQRLNRTGPLETKEVVHIGRQIAEGLAAAHATGLIHRDIKPGNILIEKDEVGRMKDEQGKAPSVSSFILHPSSFQVKITDFGLARAADDASVTHSGVVAGTPMYMSPEQAAGEQVDQRTDLFSLGSVLYAMASGRPPFRANKTLAVLKRVAEDTPRPIPDIIPEVPQWLCDVISRLHAKKPEDRFASAREVADLLARWQQHGAVPSLASGGCQPAVGEIVNQSGRLHAPLAGKKRYWVAAAVLLLGLSGLIVTEAAGVTDVRGTVIRLFSPEGTLLVEVDDPGVSVTIDGEEIIITGTGMKEIRLKPGQYQVKASKDGKTVREELIRIERNGKRAVRISREARPDQVRTDATEWEKSVVALPAEEQVKSVQERLKKVNPGFAGTLEPTIENGRVIHLAIIGAGLEDLSPVRGLSALEWLVSRSSNATLTDLTPLRGMKLKQLVLHHSAVSDLGPLKGMTLTHLDFTDGKLLTDLSPLKGMPLKMLSIPYTQVTDLSPLSGMELEFLNLTQTRATNLSPLRGMPLTKLWLTDSPVADLKPLIGMPLVVLVCARTQVSDLSPLAGMQQLKELSFQDTQVKSLSPLEGLPLEMINCSNTQVSDLTPLKGMKLTNVYCDGTRAPDLSVLKGMPLELLNCRGYDLTTDVNQQTLRSSKKLAIINSVPAAKFWMEANRKK
jgi:serine/threonine protein kinase